MQDRDQRNLAGNGQFYRYQQRKSSFPATFYTAFSS